MQQVNFYPRPPRGGRPLNRRTIMQQVNFYPRPPRGGRPLNRRTIMQQVNFYPRPPRGGRPLNRRTIMQQVNFYPRPPRGGRLTVHGPEDLVDAISIHALREEGDRRGPLSGREKCRFLSTPSARRATWSASGAAARPRFLSTPSARRATFPVLPAWCPGQISIHALREEGDRSSVTREMMV